MHPNPRKIFPLLILVLLLAAAWWYFGSDQVKADTGILSASGTIEAIQASIAPELSGLVLEVLADEGDVVQRGTELFRQDAALLQAQWNQAQTAVAQAEANYALVAAGPTAEQRQLAVAAARLELTRAEQALEALSDNADVVAAQARQAVAVADKALDKAQQRLDSMTGVADPADVDAAWAAVVLAKDRLDKANKDFEPYRKKAEDNVVRAMFQSKVAETQKQYDATVTRYNNIVGTSNRFELALAEADLALAQVQLDEAREQYEEVADGPEQKALELAQARLEAAKAQLAAALADPSPEQLALAQAQVDTAQANLQVIQAQLDRLVLVAPMDGVILSRHVEPGEFVIPGTPLITLARLDKLTITVYVPEDRYGAIQLGQVAKVQVDSFPGQVFEAMVLRIADQAEFTPRNVQTEQGRRSTVFAVKLSVENPEGQLKPGMPADVIFNSG